MRPCTLQSSVHGRVQLRYNSHANQRSDSFARVRPSVAVDGDYNSDVPGLRAQRHRVRCLPSQGNSFLFQIANG
jgi:hypothetical protein